MKTEATFSWGAAPRESGNGVAVHYFGAEPLFAFDPCDDANRPPPGDPMRIWWRIYPGFFRRVFQQALTAGLRDLGHRAGERGRMAASSPPITCAATATMTQSSRRPRRIRPARAR
jgi:hypothetical protein